MTRPAGSGFSWAEDGGAFVATPVQSLVDLGYAPGSPAESLTLNDGLRQLGLWSQYLAGISPSANVLVVDEVRSRVPAWDGATEGSAIELGSTFGAASYGAVSIATLGSGNLFLTATNGDIRLTTAGGQTVVGSGGAAGSIDTLSTVDGRRFGYGAAGRTFGVRLIPSSSGRLSATVADSTAAGVGWTSTGTLVWRVELPTIAPQDGGAAGDLYELPANLYLQAMRTNTNGSGAPHPTIAAKLFRVDGPTATELTDSTLSATDLTNAGFVEDVTWAIDAGDRDLSVATDATDGAVRYVAEITIVGATDRRVDLYGLGFRWTRREAH